MTAHDPRDAAPLPPPAPLEQELEPDNALPEEQGSSARGDGPDRKDAEALYAQRLWIGYALGLAALLLLGVVLGGSLWSLHALKAPTSWLEERFLFVQLGVHGAITVAFVWFLYQVLRLAERLVLPYWWVAKEQWPARTMLGIKDPVSTTAKLVAEAAAALEPLVRRTGK